MRGHIRKRAKDSWSVVVELPRDPETGRRRQKWVTVKGTKRDAERVLAEMVAEIERGTYVEPSKLTVAEYLDMWLRDCASASVRPTTLEGYEVMVRRHLMPELGDILLPRLTPLHVQGLYRKMTEQGLSPRTVRLAHAVLRQSLAQAVKWGFLGRNVCDAVELPRQAHKEMRVLTPEEAKRFLEAAKGERLEALWVLALTTGMRKGELLGLRWQDVDLERATLEVRQSLVRVHGKPVFQQPKTARARRTVELTPLAVEALRRHRAKQAQERLLAGSSWLNHGLVFCQRDGRPLDPMNVYNRNFKRVLAKAGLDGVRLHDLRHTHATLLLKSGANPKVVSERLGHASTAFTMDVYSHVLPGLQRDAALKVDQMLGAEIGGSKQK
ncbi:MAG: tyrosine-type recombinase/integrase [Bacillota bacterium]